MHFVVLSSSRGTTFQAVLDAIADRSLTMQCSGLITDRADRGCMEKARRANIPVVIIHKNPDESREEYDQKLSAAIEELTNKRTNEQTSKPVLACMGWMWILSPWFIKKWKNKILNVHPSLLPKYPGIHAHEEVLAAKEKESGMTIHLIDEGVDTGKILMQKTCPVLPEDTVDSLKNRVQDLEKEWYPKVLQMIEEGEIQFVD